MKSRLNRPIGTLTPMPTVKLSLGQYVVTKARSGGTARVYFQVPERLRPDGWAPAIPLPINGPRTGDLTNALEIAAIQADAKGLHVALTRARAGLEAKADARTLDVLIAAWEASSGYPKSAKTQTGYRHYAKRVRAWGESDRVDPGVVTQARIEEFLAVFNANPSTKKHVFQVLRMIMNQARAKGWRTDNPCDGIRISVETSRAQVWEQADVDAYVAQARASGRSSIALIILLEWEIGQRLTDVRAFMSGNQYDAKGGVFRFHQSKTDSYVTIPVSGTLRELLEPAAKGELFLFLDEVTRSGYTEERLSRAFREIGDAVAAKAYAAGQPIPRKLLLKWLRHSCVVQLARHGCTPIEIAAITGHAVASVVQILSVYLPRDNDVAWNAQAKRGLVAKRGAS